ncbi:MAG: hypothetical protein E7444_05650 [Ruminococcaceae bacterium]|nr:hypothetical protein [Oscillospiraceae bacterium]
MKIKAGLSAVLGVLFGLLGYYVFLQLGFDQPFQLASLTGLLFALLLILVLDVYGRIMDRRYAKFEKEITSPIFYRTNGNFNLGNGKVKNGNIYFCEAGIVCVCLEEKPYTLDEILLQNIDHYTYTFSQLNVFTNDGRLFVITVPKADEIIDLLIRKGWILPR